MQEVKNDIENSYPIQALYRPFDIRHTLISKNSQGVMFRPRFDTVKHLLKENLGLLCCKRQTSFDFQHTFITKNAVERCAVSLQTGEISYVFPLYLYPETKTDSLFSDKERKPNLDHNIVNELSQKLNLRYTFEKETTEKEGVGDTFAPIDILDYIYAVLHSPKYRETYKEFLKIDFPRVPYPKDADTFWKLVEKGSQIRALHLMESPLMGNLITTFPVSRDQDPLLVEKIKFEGEEVGKVFINSEEYFDQVPKIAWEFYIGGYQPAQKWLKDRKGRELSFDDITHYQKIIVALVNTDRLMKEIDEIDFMG